MKVTVSRSTTPPKVDDECLSEHQISIHKVLHVRHMSKYFIGEDFCVNSFIWLDPELCFSSKKQVICGVIFTVTFFTLSRLNEDGLIADQDTVVSDIHFAPLISSVNNWRQFARNDLFPSRKSDWWIYWGARVKFWCSK